MSRKFDPVSGKVVPVFFHYAVPSVVGMLAATSAGVIYGMFIGNFVGAGALAAVNISLPAFYLFAAVVFMMGVGGSVMCGKFLGERNRVAASDIFSRTLYATTAVAGLIAGLSLVFLDDVVRMLGANTELQPLVREYMQIILLASPLLILALTLDWFVRVDGRPVLASFALIMFAVCNVSLDWLFIVKWGWGLSGAAWATALSEGVILLILVTHFFSHKRTISLVRVAMRWRDGWDSVFRAAWNGFSEFANEMSLALVTLLFNWVMITRLGVPGVAAFTIIGYLLMVGIEICYGIADSLGPTVSKNLGARQAGRIARFTQVAMLSAFLTGLLACALLILVPEWLVSIFLEEGESAAGSIALAFIAVFWPAFLFNGMNITLASYFTALHKPLQSAVIAISRSLLLPALGLIFLPRWLGDTGVFISIPVAEALTFVLALVLVSANRPSRVVDALDAPRVQISSN